MVVGELYSNKLAKITDFKDVIKLIGNPSEDLCDCFNFTVLPTEWLDETKQINFGYINEDESRAYFESD